MCHCFMCVIILYSGIHLIYQSHPVVMAEAVKPLLTEDDSCVAGYIEIVPLDRARIDYTNDICNEIKPVQDIKQEIEEVHEVCDDVKYEFPAEEVRLSLYALHY